MDTFNFDEQATRFIHGRSNFSKEWDPVCLTVEEIQYFDIIRKTEGFDLLDMDSEKLRHVHHLGKIIPFLGATAVLIPLVSDCLRKRNKEEGTGLQLVEITNCNWSYGGSRPMYYITLRAKDAKEEVESCPNVYQLCVVKGLADEGNKIKVFRLKPSPPAACSPSKP